MVLVWLSKHSSVSRRCVRCVGLRGRSRLPSVFTSNIPCRQITIIYQSHHHCRRAWPHQHLPSPVATTPSTPHARPADTSSSQQHSSPLRRPSPLAAHPLTTAARYSGVLVYILVYFLVQIVADRAQDIARRCWAGPGQDTADCSSVSSLVEESGSWRWAFCAPADSGRSYAKLSQDRVLLARASAPPAREALQTKLGEADRELCSAEHCIVQPTCTLAGQVSEAALLRRRAEAADQPTVTAGQGSVGTCSPSRIIHRVASRFLPQRSGQQSCG